MWQKRRGTKIQSIAICNLKPINLLIALTHGKDWGHTMWQRRVRRMYLILYTHNSKWIHFLYQQTALNHYKVRAEHFVSQNCVTHWICLLGFPPSRCILVWRILSTFTPLWVPTGRKCLTQGHPQAPKGTCGAPMGHPAEHPQGQPPGPALGATNNGPMKGQSQPSLRVWRLSKNPGKTTVRKNQWI